MGNDLEAGRSVEQLETTKQNVFTSCRDVIQTYMVNTPKMIQSVHRIKAIASITHQLHRVLNLFVGTPDLRETAWLDGLRGLASFEVYIFHSSYSWGYRGRAGLKYGWRVSKYTDDWFRLPFIRLLYGSGALMVAIFFVISGLVLTRKSLQQIRAKQTQKLVHDLSSAAFRRLFRIYIPMIIASLLTVILYELGLGKTVNAIGFDQTQSRAGLAVHWLTELNRMTNIFAYKERYMQIKNVYAYSSWTLPLEIYGSFVCYLLMLVMARMTSYRVRSAILLLLCLYTIYNNTWHVFLFLFGIGLGDYELMTSEQATAAPQIRSAKYSWAQTVFWSAVLVASLWVASWPEFFEVTKQHKINLIWWMNATGCGTILAIYNLPSIRGFFDSPAMQYLGRISFGVYLIHHSIIVLLVQPYLKPFLSLYLHHSISAWATFVLQTIMVILTGHYFTKYIDLPAVQATRRLEEKLIDK